jgi:hypothetical protein
VGVRQPVTRTACGKGNEVYIAFIGLGIPDSLFGTAWPAIYTEFGFPISFASFVTVIISCGTTVSSIVSAKVIAKFGTNNVSAFSTAITACHHTGSAVYPTYMEQGTQQWADIRRKRNESTDDQGDYSDSRRKTYVVSVHNILRDRIYLRRLGQYISGGIQTYTAGTRRKTLERMFPSL